QPTPSAGPGALGWNYRVCLYPQGVEELAEGAVGCCCSGHIEDQLVLLSSNKPSPGSEDFTLPALGVGTEHSGCQSMGSFRIRCLWSPARGPSRECNLLRRPARISNERFAMSSLLTQLLCEARPTRIGVRTNRFCYRPSSKYR